MGNISVVIPSWNAKSFLQNCINSLLKEGTLNHSEIIVVDNASSDGSAEMVQELFPQIRLIKNSDNLGFAKACNIGMRVAKGEYIIVVNSDVIVGKECISRMRVYMDQHREIGILGPKIVGPDGFVQRSCMGFPTLWNSFCRAFALDTIFPKSKLLGGQLMTYWTHDTIRGVDVINGCFWMVRREAIIQVGLLDERFFIYAEDKDWCKRFRKAGWEVTFFPEAEAIHFGGGSSSNSPIRFQIEMERANLQYWEKNHNRAAQINYRLITLLHHLIRIIGHVVVFIFWPIKRKQSAFNIKKSIAGVQWYFQRLIPLRNK